ncbi:cytidine deaminase [Tissierellaceae bacterium HCP3S3_D8]
MNKTQLIEMALKAQKKAYVPYSNFHVGATVLMKDGSIYTGCNIEVSSYSPTICAERTAIFKAVSEGSREIDTIVIVGDADPTYPCGVCRQVIREFGRDAKIIIASSVDRYREYTIDDLLPHSFGPEDLEENR